MQIRIGNKQDEASVRELVARVISGNTGDSGASLSLDLTGEFRDLINIEANYIGHDGTFLVAEQERQVIGFALARSKPGAESDTVCVLKRLVVDPSIQTSTEELIERLIEKVEDFAGNLDYRILQVELVVAAPNMEIVLNRLDYDKTKADDTVVYSRQLNRR